MALYNAFGDLRTQSPTVGPAVINATLGTTVGSTLDIDTNTISGVLIYLRSGATAAGVITIEGLIDPGDASSWAPLPAVRMDSGPSLLVGALTTLGASTSYRYRVDVNGLTRIRLRVTTALGSALAAIAYQKHIDAEPLFSVNVPSGTQAISGSVTAVVSGVSEQAETSTNLAANATYTGTSRDLGTTSSTRPTLIRPMVMHNAGLTPGTLILQESTDASTWRETRRTPVPSDSSYRTFEWPIHMRYYRLLFTNGATAQTGFYLHAVRVQGEAGTMDAKNNLSFLLSTTALSASGTFTSATLDLGDNHIWDMVRLRVHTDQASATDGIRIETSHDGTNWGYSVSGSLTKTADARIVGIERPITERYIRLVVANGTTAQTFLRATLALVSL